MPGDGLDQGAVGLAGGQAVVTLRLDLLLPALLDLAEGAFDHIALGLAWRALLP